MGSPDIGDWGWLSESIPRPSIRTAKKRKTQKTALKNASGKRKPKHILDKRHCLALNNNSGWYYMGRVKFSLSE